MPLFAIAMPPKEVSPDSEKRRTSPRVSELHLMSLGGSSGPTSLGRTLDVGESGVRVEVLGPIGIEDEVRLEIAVGEGIVAAHGRVVHASRKEHGLIEVGIEFTSIENQDRDILASLNSEKK